MSFGLMGGIAKGVGLALKAGMGAFKSGDMKQVGGEYYSPPVPRLLSDSRWEADIVSCRFLVGPGEVCRWGHRMTNTRDHVEIEELRRVLKLDEGREEVGNSSVETVEGTEMSKEEEVNNNIDTPAPVATPPQVSV
jgi:hypothetical protein